MNIGEQEKILKELMPRINSLSFDNSLETSACYILVSESSHYAGLNHDFEIDEPLRISRGENCYEINSLKGSFKSIFSLGIETQWSEASEGTGNGLGPRFMDVPFLRIPTKDGREARIYSPRFGSE